MAGPRRPDSGYWDSAPCQGHQELSQDPGPRTQDLEDMSTYELSARKALLDLKMPGVCLVRAVQGPLQGDRSHPGSKLASSSQWGLDQGGAAGRGQAERCSHLATYAPAYAKRCPMGISPRDRSPLKPCSLLATTAVNKSSQGLSWASRDGGQ